MCRRETFRKGQERVPTLPTAAAASGPGSKSILNF